MMRELECGMTGMTEDKGTFEGFGVGVSIFVMRAQPCYYLGRHL